MKILQVYLDTSILNFAISKQDVQDERNSTLAFLDQIREDKLEGYISDIVLEEIDAASEFKQKELLNIIRNLPLERLPVSSEADHLAEKYIRERVIPKRYRNDALHLAIASVNNLDVVVSWNFEHLVKVKTRREVKGINTLMGYSEIDIATPKEVIQDERT